jgi:hypothetical protein
MSPSVRRLAVATGALSFALLPGCTVELGSSKLEPPQPVSVEPPNGSLSSPVPVTIIGTRFTPFARATPGLGTGSTLDKSFKARLVSGVSSTDLLDVTWLDDQHLTAIVPANALAVGPYDLVVRSPNGLEGTLSNAYRAYQLSCPTGNIVCGTNCVDPQTDHDHCGASGDCTGASAGLTCSSGETCSAGTCTLGCVAGLVYCGGKCVDPATSNAYCGASGSCTGASAGTACAAGLVCNGGSCALSCAAGLVKCNGTCVDPGSDRDFSRTSVARSAPCPSATPRPPARSAAPWTSAQATSPRLAPPTSTCFAWANSSGVIQGSPGFAGPASRTLKMTGEISRPGSPI